MTKLAIHGGKPIRNTYLSYGRHTIKQDDIDSVVSVLKSDKLTTGEWVERYEDSFAEYHGYKYGIAVNSGTAALHCALRGMLEMTGKDFSEKLIHIKTSPLTFAATSNTIIQSNAIPVFADIDSETLNITDETIQERLSLNDCGIVPVDYGGLACSVKYSNSVIVDASHSIGIKQTGFLARCYSTHAVKNMTTGEGGMIITDNDDLAQVARTFRNHGIDKDYKNRDTWIYDIPEIGYNYRLTDFQCALGYSQLQKLERFNKRRAEIAKTYIDNFKNNSYIIGRKINNECSWHLFVILLNLEKLKADRERIFKALQAENIGVNVHYIPIYRFGAYKEYAYYKELCPNTEWAYERLLSLPIFPAMTDDDVQDVIMAVNKVLYFYGG